MNAEQRRPAEQPEAAEQPETPRLERRRRTWHHRLLSENVRSLIALVIAGLIGAVLQLAVPDLNYMTTEDPRERIILLTLLLVLVGSIYFMVTALLVLLVMRGMPRARQVALARLPRARLSVRWYRWVGGSSGPVGNVVSLVVNAVAASLLLIIRPGGVSVTYLLLLTAGAIITVWISTVVTYAMEYMAQDARGDAFSLPGTPGPERTFSDYLYAAVVVQASSGTVEFVPVTTPARRIVRNHVILAHVISTVLISLGVSVVISAVS